MKLYKYILSAFVLIGGLASCTDFLSEKPDGYTTESLFTTPEGIEKMVIGLYQYERYMTAEDQGQLACHIWLDRTTDIVKFMTGGDAGVSRYTNAGSDNTLYNRYWKHRYFIIARANEIVHYGSLLGDKATRSVAEGAFWRAYSYYSLWSRYEAVYLGTAPIDEENVLAVAGKRAEEEKVFEQMLNDVELAIAGLPLSDKGSGRVIKATAWHLKALIKSWQRKHEDVLICVEEIEKILNDSGLEYANDVSTLFRSRDYTKNPETLFSLTYSKARGGIGNRIGSQYIANQYDVKYTWEKRAGAFVKHTDTNLGRGWALAFPNSYLMSRYPEGDKRLDAYFKRGIVVMNPDELSKGLVLPAAELKTDVKTGRQYYTTSNHTGAAITLKAGDVIEGRDVPYISGGKELALLVREATVSSIKFHDWEKQLDVDGAEMAEKDVMIFRLSETYLLGAESAVLSGNKVKASEYFNKSWTRAGNAAETNVTFEMVRDEQARELCFEGRRWDFLKRNDLWYTHMISYAGDFTAYPTATLTDYNPAKYGTTDGRDVAFGPNPDYYADFSDGLDRDVQLRFIIQPFHAKWPIPLNQLNSAGMENFGQNEGY